MISKTIVFLNRAYNDLDIQFSLIETFARDESYKVKVIGIASDGDLFNPAIHENLNYISSNFPDIYFGTILDEAQAPLTLKTLYKIEQVLRKLKVNSRQKLLKKFYKLFHIPFLRFLSWQLKKPMPWLQKAAKNWNADALVIDEIVVQPNRSYMVDFVIPELLKSGTKLFGIQTGQYVYPDIHQDLGMATYKESNASVFFVPGNLDKQIRLQDFPRENYSVLGNLRMDKGWIKKLHSEILVDPYYHEHRKLKRLHDRPIKIVMMLSKLSYGVDVSDLKEVISILGHMDNVSLAIKPHTRGMKLDFMKDRELGDAQIVEDIPSTLLLDWADMALFTGSGIGFHAMVLHKHLVLLENCKSFKTIFDDGGFCHVVSSTDDLKELVAKLEADNLENKNNAEWIKNELHGGDKDGQVALNYKKKIQEHLSMQHSINEYKKQA